MRETKELRGGRVNDSGRVGILDLIYTLIEFLSPTAHIVATKSPKPSSRAMLRDRTAKHKTSWPDGRMVFDVMKLRAQYCLSARQCAGPGRP